MTADPQVHKLEQEILADANARAERIVARAKNDAAKLQADLETQAERKREERLQEAKNIAETETRSILQEAEQEIKRKWLQLRETSLEKVLFQAMEQATLSSGEERAASLRGLAREALQALGSVDCQVSVAPADISMVTGEWLQDLSQGLVGAEALPTFTVQADSAINGGISFLTADGSRSFDNTYASRLHWMKTELRRLASQTT